MNQMMVIESKNTKIQDTICSNQKFTMHSSADIVKCDVCGKGLGNGFSITAKSVFNETRFFCKAHLNY